MANAKTNFEGKWEQRWHPLRQEWVVYSAHRDTRPWHGATETETSRLPAYDPQCYLCPGNRRISGQINPDYDGVYVFDNDHPVVGMNAPEVIAPDFQNPIFKRRSAHGLARVVCYDPRHNVTLADISLPRVTQVFMALREQMQEFLKMERIKFVLIFENKGEITGVSSPHPHCQIYATNFTFKYIETELKAANEFRAPYQQNLFAAILDFEKNDERRIVAENESAIAFVPFCARFAYEVWIFPKKRHATLATLTDIEIADLSSTFQEVAQRYDLLYNMPFPYVMTFYQSPVDGEHYNDYHFHLMLLPLLRQPGLRKFLAGPEIGGGNFMVDSMPEDKAAELRRIDLNQIK